MNSEEGKYELWNYMVADTFLLSDSPDGTVQLTITPQTLATAYEEAQLGLLTPEEAEASLIASVSAVYASRVQTSPHGLRALSSSHSEDIPYGTGFLALTVLAAFHMRTDDEHTAAAFYPRLAEMLGCSLMGTYPDSFNGGDYIALWAELNEWLMRKYERRLAMPDPNSHRRYLAFPLAHVPLREVDIKRLPQFFDTHGYEPGLRPSKKRLSFDLVERSGPWQHLTEAGRKALQDPGRRSFVVRQVAHELEHWDGGRTDTAGNRIASIELWMDIKKRRPELHLLARRPSGFPDTFRSGEYVFEASYEGWYEAVPLGRNDGPLLSQGLRIGTGLSRRGFSLQLRSCCGAVPLTPSPEYPGFVSDHALRVDTQCAVLCTEEMADEVASYLETVCGEQCHARRDETLPTGWCLFTNVRPVNSIPPPAGLERLAIESGVQLLCEGGLRLGRRWTWLEDAPAQVRVVGSRAGLVVKIDGQESELDEDGCFPKALLAKRGEHIIEVGNRIRRKAIVVPGKINPDCQHWPQTQHSRMSVALPEGDWFVVGSNPSEFLAAIIPSGGATVRPDFRASWAIRVGTGSGATALHLHDEADDEPTCEIEGPPSTKNTTSRKGDGRGSKFPDRASSNWAETIYQANIRRPMLGCSFGCSATEVTQAWRWIAKRARAWKRQKKRSGTTRRTFSGTP